MADEISPWELKPSDLKSFVSEHLRQKLHFAETIAEVLRNLVLFITKNASYSIARTVVSGDLTGGTTAITEDAEFQLSIYISDFRSIGDYRRDIKNVLAETRALLGSDAVEHTVMLRGKESAGDGSVPVRIKMNTEWYEGKITPAVDLIGGHPSKSHKETMFRQFMQDKDKLPYQPTLQDLRQQFLKSVPCAVKDLILLVKFWIKNRLRLRGDKPAMRFFELFAIDCWEKAGTPEQFDLAQGLKSVLLSLGDWKNIKLIWDKSERRAYPRKIADEKWRNIIARRNEYDEPLALDPIDPRLEYCVGVKILIWEETSRTVRESLLEPLFQGLSESSKW